MVVCRKGNIFRVQEKDLDSIVSLYDTMARIFQASDENKLKAIPLVLSGDAFIYYSSNAQDCLAYDEAMSTPRLWYNNLDNRARILTK